MNKKLNIALWIVQVFLALLFGFAGFTKLTTPVEEQIAAGMAYLTTTGAAPMFIAGAAELAASVGLILPSALRIQPKLTAYAAAGLVVIMILAFGLHAYLGEFSSLPVNVVLGGLAAFVAWGRLKGAPIAPKS